MVKLYKIRFLKDTELKQAGEIGEATKKNADGFVNNGYAEYIVEEPINTPKIEKVDKQEMSETSETTDTSETSETTDTSSNLFHLFQFGHVSAPLEAIFQKNNTDEILQWFLVNKNTQISIADLAEKMGKKKDSIRTAINRYKRFFSDTGYKGKAGLIQVNHEGIDEIMKRQDIYFKNEAQRAELEKKKERLKELDENYDSQVVAFLTENKLERIGNNLIIDFNDISELNKELADMFLENPDRFINKIKDYYDSELNVTIINLPKSNCISIEQIRKEHLDKVISLDGRVTSFGEVKPVVIETVFECPSCGTILRVKQNYRIGTINEPKGCGCGRKGGFLEMDREEINACFIQLEDLQDRTDNPHSQRIKAVLFNGLCDESKIKIFSPGNEIRTTGIIKRVPIFKNQKETVFTTLIYEIMTAELLEKEVEINNIEQKDMDKINELSNKINEQGLEPIISSFAPDVFGYESIKGALCLQACNKRNERSIKTVRNKSNILLIGDPGVAKSVMCDFALSVQNGRKAVGGGSSAVGITASVVKEEDSLGGYRVEPGAMILAKDILFLDEMNNLSDEDKPKLQEGMNEQTISINKANLHVQMKVTCGILAVANPKKGHFNQDSSFIVDEFNIPSPILNRFDAIFVVKDNINEDTDKKIAEKMIKRHRGKLIPLYDKNFLKLFFTYIKNLPEPEINDEGEKLLGDIYSKARMNRENTVKINPRFLESLTRMATSAAKIRQSKLVEKKDIIVALKILSDSQYKVNEYIAS